MYNEVTKDQIVGRELWKHKRRQELASGQVANPGQTAVRAVQNPPAEEAPAVQQQAMELPSHGQGEPVSFQ
jgi:hypothetical protein